MLFSEIKRTDNSPRRHAETHYGFLDRSARTEYSRIRALLEGFLAAYPPEERGDLARRFQSGRDQDAQSVFLELLLFQLLRKTGHTVQVHPVVQNTNRRPDFLAKTSYGSAALLEAKVVTELSDEKRRSDKLLGVALDQIELIESPDYMLSIKSRGVPLRPIPAKKNWCPSIRSWLNELDYDAISQMFAQGGFSALPSLALKSEGIRLTIKPLPKNRTLRGAPGVRTIGSQMLGDASWVTSRASIRKAIEEKASAYGAVEEPFIVVVNSIGEQSDIEELHCGIFGSDGVFRDIANPEHTRVSAVLATYELYPWSIGSAFACLFHNPNAQRPYDGHLNCLSQARQTVGGVQITDGTTIGEILGIPKHWPKSESDD